MSRFLEREDGPLREPVDRGLLRHRRLPVAPRFAWLPADRLPRTESSNWGDTRSYQVDATPIRLATSPVQAQPAMSQAVNSGSTSRPRLTGLLESINDRRQIGGSGQFLLSQGLPKPLFRRSGHELQEQMGVARLVLVADFVRVVLTDLSEPLNGSGLQDDSKLAKTCS